jgi:hypothetical protein
MPATYTDSIDGLTTSVAEKAPVVVATNGAITLSGEQTVNGIACVEGDRVLVKDQDDSTTNGIYVCSDSAWSRALDFNGNRDVVKGTSVRVAGPSVSTGSLYIVTTENPIVIGTSAIVFVQKPEGTSDSTQFVSMEDLRVSTTDQDYVETLAFYASGTTGAAKLYRDGTGTPTGSGAAVIAAALAAGTFCNAAGHCYKLRTDQEITLYTFGFAAASDETDSVLAAITFTAGVCKLFWPPATCNSDPIVVPSNSHWVFHRECILKATAGYGSTSELLDFTSADDVTLECNGATFQMLKSEYVSGEARHCFNLVNCSDVLITNPNAIDSGGDGYYVNGATRVTLVNPRADNNRRNAMSVIKATDFNCVGIAKLLNSTGTAPQSGLVIEPNSDADSLVRVNFQTVEVTGNATDGVNIYLDDYKAGAPADVSINIDKIISRGNAGRALRISNVYLNSGSYEGSITVGEVISTDDGQSAVSIADKGTNGPFLKIGPVTAFNPCTGASTFQHTAAVYIEDDSAAPSGGMHIGPISARATHTDMDYGVIVEMGQGLADTRIEIENVRGQQVTPVRLNNTTSTVAEASDLIVSMGKLMETVAITTGTNIVATAHLGRIVTNTGAAGSVTAALREYPPAGNPYRFRVTEAQTLAIDTFDATDRIVGTTTAGATVTSNVVGAECEVFYIGTLGGVRYWKLNPIGPAASWTFN